MPPYSTWNPCGTDLFHVESSWNPHGICFTILMPSDLWRPLPDSPAPASFGATAPPPLAWLPSPTFPSPPALVPFPPWRGANLAPRRTSFGAVLPLLARLRHWLVPSRVWLPSSGHLPFPSASPKGISPLSGTPPQSRTLTRSITVTAALPLRGGRLPAFVSECWYDDVIKCCNSPVCFVAVWSLTPIFTVFFCSLGRGD